MDTSHDLSPPRKRESRTGCRGNTLLPAERHGTLVQGRLLLDRDILVPSTPPCPASRDMLIMLACSLTRIKVLIQGAVQSSTPSF